MTKVIKIVTRQKPYVKVVSRIDLRKWGNIFGNIEDQSDLIALFQAYVKTVNGVEPDENGNVNVGGSVETVNGISPDGNGNVELTPDDIGAEEAGAAAIAEVNAKAYADTLVIGLLDDRGNYDASGNTFPAAGGSGVAGAILKGDLWTISVAGVLGGVAVTVGDVVRALTDTPGQTAANWVITENNLGYVPENSANGELTLTNSTIKFPRSSTVYNELASILPFMPIVSGEWRGVMGISNVASAGWLTGSNWFSPYLVEKKHTVVGIRTFVGGSAGASIRLALFDSNGLYPHNPLDESGVIDCSASGLKQYNFVNPIVLTGQLYWIGLQTSVSTGLTIRYFTQGAIPILSAQSGSNYSACRLVNAYGAFATNINPASLVLTMGTNIPVIELLVQ